jgi:nucleoside diphosphate kinase
MEQALTFIKPHAMISPLVPELVRARLTAAGIEIRHCRDIDGAAVAREGLVDRHYAAHARAALCENPASLPLGTAAREVFRRAFGETWEEAVAAGRVTSAEVCRRRRGMDAETLGRLWDGLCCHKLAAGLYVARLPQEDVYVLNGFYPSVRERFTAPEARLRLLLTAFDISRLTWRRFREEIIGATDPSRADARSIRGELYRRQAELGLHIACRDNAVHASASAFESLCEQRLWLPDHPLDDDPLWQLLRARGMRPEEIEALRVENPTVVLDGASTPLLDLLENRGAAETAAILGKLGLAGGTADAAR